MVQGAILILLNGDGRVLLQDRGDDAPAYPGQWGLFGGAVEFGETVWQALLREAMEELRHDASNAKFAFVWRGVDPVRGACERHYYIDRYHAGQILELHEGQAMGWFTFDELQTLDLAPNITLEMDRIRKVLSGHSEAAEPRGEP
jgi:8-oxo-dGTP diphosphatase